MTQATSDGSHATILTGHASTCDSLVILALALWLAVALLLTRDDTTSRTSLAGLLGTGFVLGCIWAWQIFRNRGPEKRSRFSRAFMLSIYPIVSISVVGDLLYTDSDIVKQVPVVSRLDWSNILGNTAALPAARRSKHHLRFVNEASSAGKLEILLIGNSITDHWRSEGKAIWAKEFGHLKSLNFGIAGDRIQNVLWRIQHGELDGIRPNVIMLEVGTNNLNRNTNSEIVAAIDILASEMHARSPKSKLLLLSILPRGLHLLDPINARIAAINSELQSLSATKSFQFLDFGDKLADNQGSLVRAMPLGLHLSEDGYKVWAEAIIPLLNP